MKEIKIYLAGAIDKKADNGCKYRNIAENVCKQLSDQNLILTPINPFEGEVGTWKKYGTTPENWEVFKRTNWKNAKKFATEIRQKDLKQIRQCDAMLVFLDEAVNYGAGTKGEMTVVAEEYKIPIFIVKKIPRSSIKFWVIGCMDVDRPEYSTIQEALVALRDYFLEEIK